MGLPLCLGFHLHWGLSDSSERSVILCYLRNGKSTHQTGPLGKHRILCGGRRWRQREICRKYTQSLSSAPCLRKKSHIGLAGCCSVELSSNMATGRESPMRRPLTFHHSPKRTSVFSAPMMPFASSSSPHLKKC